MARTFNNKNVVVVGIARSGTGAANLLDSLGAKVAITDRKPRSSLEGNIMKLSPTVQVRTDDNHDDVFGEADMIVISPGVPLDIVPLVKAKTKGVPVIGELELAYQVIQSFVMRRACRRGGRPYAFPLQKGPHFIGVTGTNGKSTTTTLIDLMLKASGYKTIFGGNIGNALTEAIQKTFSTRHSAAGSELTTELVQSAADYIVAEISSFQLESIREFRPRVAVILNITPDHLDRYDRMEDYMNAKARIFENQTSDDYLILNADDPLTMELYNAKCKMQKAKLPETLFFSRKKEVKGIYQRNGIVYQNFGDPERRKGLPLHVPSNSELVKVDEIKIRGVHNLENGMAAALAACISGCSGDAIRDVLRNFSGLEHRLEFVHEIRGVTFLNDSKGTNIGAVAKSLEGFDNIILIMGGTDKGGDFSLLADLVKRKVKSLILLGEAKEKIAGALGGLVETHEVNDLREAVELSMAQASAGDIVLLSPGCASFDMFTDFEDRGKKFKEAVRALRP